MFKLATDLFQKKLVRDALALNIGRGLNLLVGIVSTLMFGIVFLNKQIAVISLIEMVANLFLAFGASWSSVGIIRYGKEEYINHQSLNYTSTIRFSIVFPLVVLSAAILILFSDTFLSFIGTRDITIILYLIVNLILLVFHDHITRILTTVEKHFWNALFFLTLSVGKLCILFTFYFNILNVSAELYFKLNVFLLVTLALLRIPLIEKNFLFPLRPIDKNDLLKYLKFVMPQIYGFAGMYLINWMDAYFIRKYYSFDDLGVYQFLYSIFLKIGSFAFLINTLFFPKLVAWKDSGQEKIDNYLKKAPYIFLGATTLGIGIFILTYQPIFSIFFTDQYVTGYSAFNVLLLAVPLYFLTFTFIPALNSFDKVATIQLINIVSALFNLVIDALLVKKFGFMAAAFGTLTAYGCQCFLLMMAVRKIFNINYRILVTLVGSSLLLVLYYVFRMVLHSF